jgi:hypothetical protein
MGHEESAYKSKFYWDVFGVSLLSPFSFFCYFKGMERGLLLLMCLVGCSPSSLEELRWEGESETKKLTAELREIEGCEQLRNALPRLKKRYNKIARLVEQAKPWGETAGAEPSAVSEELFIELARLYEIPGARELIEVAQQEALKRLDPDRQTNQP